MVTIEFNSTFKKRVSKIKDKKLKAKVKKQIIKIINNPLIGKPMRFTRKDTREVYIKPFRLSYLYIKNKKILVFLEFYHKNEQ